MLSAASCFSGIGAPELGGPQFDWKWCAEIEKFPAAVLAKRFPNSVNLGDVTADDFMQRASSYGRLDLLVGGPPCQAFSVAGLRKSMGDDRGNLSLRFVKIAHAIRPRNLLVENVSGWLSMPDNAFGSFLGGLVGADDALLPCAKPASGKSNAGWSWRKAGMVWRLRDDNGEGIPILIENPEDYESDEIEKFYVDARHVPKWPSVGMVAGPRARAAWRIFDAQYAGVAQRRRRVFVVADFGDGADPAQILFERRSLHGDNPPRRETGQGTTHDVAPSLVSSGRGVERTGETRGQDPVVACAEIAPTLNAHFGDKQGLEDQHINGGGGLFVATCGNPVFATDGQANAAFADNLALTLNATNEQPYIAAPTNRCDFDVAHTLKGEGFDASEDGTGRGTPIVPVEPFVMMERGREGGSNPEYRNDGTANAILTPNGGRGGMGVGAIAGPVAFSSKDSGSDATDDLSPTLRSMGHADSHANGGGQVAVAIQAGALRENPNSSPDGVGVQSDIAYTIEARAEVQAVAFAENQQGSVYEMDVFQLLNQGGGKPGQSYPAVRVGLEQNWQVRRLTPTECERLQGFPDGFTDVEYRGKPAADGPRYKALGNSWAVPCGAWILARIAKGLEANQ